MRILRNPARTKTAPAVRSPAGMATADGDEEG